MNVEIGTVAAQFLFWEYFIFVEFSVFVLCSVRVITSGPRLEPAIRSPQSLFSLILLCVIPQNRWLLMVRRKLPLTQRTLFEIRLKGHGNEADFLGFFRNWVLIDPLHYISSRSAFDFKFAEISPRLGESANRRLSDSASRGVTDSPTWRVGESTTVLLLWAWLIS